MKNIEDKLKNFHLDPTGEYVYDGSYMQWNEDIKKEERDRTKKTVPALSLLSSILLIILGCFKGTGMDGNPFMMLPYAADIIISLITVWKIIRFFYGLKKDEGKLKEYTYKETVKTLPGLATAGIVTASLSLLGFLITVSLYEGYGTGAVLYPVICALFLIFSVLLRKESKRLNNSFYLVKE